MKAILTTTVALALLAATIVPAEAGTTKGLTQSASHYTQFDDGSSNWTGAELVKNESFVSSKSVIFNNRRARRNQQVLSKSVSMRGDFEAESASHITVGHNYIAPKDRTIDQTN